MWNKNTDTNEWFRKLDVLEKDKYDSLKQDIEKVRLYSKCLSGSTYVAINSTDNIFDILNVKILNNWYVGVSGSTYSISPMPQFPKSIDNSTKSEYYDKYAYEYGLTLKNKFTPTKLINDVIDNYIEVDVATTDSLISIIGVYTPGLTIDGVILKEGHRVLVKDQKSFISISSSIDPESYFTHSYVKEQDNITTIQYSYYNSENGIYKYTGSTLVRESDFDSYDSSYKLSVSVKLGDINTKKQYHLNRIKSGYYPMYTNGDSMEFIEKHNWVLRNRVDYNNIYEISYHDIIKHDNQTYTEDRTYYIPERVISVGEFGMILLNQSGVSNIVDNKYKVNLRSICQTTKYYWICGDEGTILRVSKLNLEMLRIDVSEPNDFRSISFADDLRGIVVGRFNTVYFTEDGGYTWKSISQAEFDSHSYNKVIYNTYDKAYIAGDTGLYMELSYVYNQWIFYKRKISKFLDTNEPTEEYLLVDDINDMCLLDMYLSPCLEYQFVSSAGNNGQISLKLCGETQSTYISVDNTPVNYCIDRNFIPEIITGTANSQVIGSCTSSYSDQYLIMVTNGGNIVLRDINNNISDFDFLYIGYTASKADIKSISIKFGSSLAYINSDKIYSIPLDTYYLSSYNTNLMTTYGSVGVEYDKYVNKIFDSNGQNLYMCGNNSTVLYTGYTASVFEIDANFNNRYSSKLLFLDYEIGSKLNFFDDSQIYRLPSSLNLNSDGLTGIGSLLVVDSKPNEVNWLSYYKDVEKTYEYYTSLDNNDQVLFSTTFSYSPGTYFTFTKDDINVSRSSILNLAPNIDNWDQSRYMYGTTPITAPTASETVFLNRYLIVFKKNTLYTVDIGDVFYLECDILKTTFIVNKKVVFGFDLYIYCFVDFEQTMVNDLKSYTGEISIVNLNKFSNIGGTASAQILVNLSDDFWNYDNNINADDYFAYAPILAAGGGDDLLINFNLHPVGYGYKLSYDNGVYTLSTKYNNKTAYYNMQSLITTSSGSYEMNYTDAFLKFGYKPTYNIYDYLNNIDSTIFTSNKQFLAMPRYQNLPGNAGGDSGPNNIWMTTNYDTNKLLFGKNLKFEFDSIWINTFVDVILYTRTSGNNPVYNTSVNERMLVMSKYYDSEKDAYVLEFHKKMKFTYFSLVLNIDILSRNTLQQISDDLQILNNIHRSATTKNLLYGNNRTGTITSLENELNFRMSTDSYSKVLLSDRSIKEHLTGIIYIDNLNELAMNIIKIEEEYNIDITSTARYTTMSNDYLLITCSQSHNLVIDDSIIVKFTGTTFSSNQYNPQFFGYQVVMGIVDDYSFWTDKIFDGIDIPYSDPGSIKYMKKDPFLNYQPIDIMELGVDKQVRRAIEINPENVILKGSNYYLENINFNKFRYELTDGISILDIYSKYPWIMEGEISNAVIGQDSNGLVWYKGDWRCGRWFGGTWMSGRWISGDWYGGIWNSYQVKYRLLNVDINKKIDDPSASKWFSGRWFGGTWNGGTWYSGRRYDGDWNGGNWYDGIWNDGTWNKGEFAGGVWVLGNWNNGKFNCNSKPSYWINGSWYGGDFENGMWYNGQFLQKTGNKSRFGTRAFNTRTAIWHSGKFSGGEFHSFLNLDNDGDPIASEYNKYSIWNTGMLSGGDWYGGIAYAINFNGGNWYGGVIEEIQIIGLDITPNKLTRFILNGRFKFNVNDEIWVVNDNNYTPYGAIGTNDSPGTYRVLLMEEVGEKTYITINQNLHSIIGTINVDNIETGLRLTTIFKNSNWKSGVWTNGIFDGGYFEGGIWYGGLFTANWGR